MTTDKISIQMTRTEAISIVQGLAELKVCEFDGKYPELSKLMTLLHDQFQSTKSY